MLGMSFTEIAIILVLALVLLGPDELPKVAKAVGKGLRELRRATDDLKSTFEQEMVKLDDDRPAGPMLVSPTTPAATGNEAVKGIAGTLDQLNDPGAARAAARAAAADPGAARAAARFHAAGLPTPSDVGSAQSATPDAASAQPPPSDPAPVPTEPSAEPSAAPSAAPSAEGAAPEVLHPATPPDSIPREKKSGSLA